MSNRHENELRMNWSANHCVVFWCVGWSSCFSSFYCTSCGVSDWSLVRQRWSGYMFQAISTSLIGWLDEFQFESKFGVFELDFVSIQWDTLMDVLVRWIDHSYSSIQIENFPYRWYSTWNHQHIFHPKRIYHIDIHFPQLPKILRMRHITNFRLHSFRIEKRVAKTNTCRSSSLWCRLRAHWTDGSTVETNVLL